MKKVFSLLLAVLMLVSAVPAAYATNDYTQGTQVVFEATGTEAYTITVPALLAPGGSGTVTLSGTWADNRIVTVTADPTVTLTNSIKATDTKTLDVNFDSISEAGSNTTSQKFTQDISIGSITDALFGTWSGKFNYNVEVGVQQPIAATFSDGTELTWSELKLAANGTKYGYDASAITDTTIGSRAFYQCTNLTSITIPDDVTSIGEDAFGYCTSLTSVNIPEGITTIAKRTFYKCNFESIAIPDSVTSIGNFAFSHCANLTSINIPDSVTSIGENAFDNCTNLTSVNIPDGVTTIEDWAFFFCENLPSIDIPASVKKIDFRAFAWSGLTTINFAGTTAQWNAITFGDQWNFNASNLTEVICSDGTVAIS